jgi:hypothetical protein
MMTSQPARQYGSAVRPIRGEVGPPEPGQAYFGYPQPSRVQFPVPTQAPAEHDARPDPRQAERKHQHRAERAQPRPPRSAERPAPRSSEPAPPTQPIRRPTPVVARPSTEPEIQGGRPTWPPMVPTGAGPAQPRPFRAHSRAARSRVALHLVGYPLVAVLGVMVAVLCLR